MFLWIAVQLKFLQISTVIIIPIMYLHQISRNQIFMSAYGGKAVISGLETYGLKLS